MRCAMISVSEHAVQRYRERIGRGASDAEIMAMLTGPAVRCAALFGARVVRIPHGRIILDHTPLGVAVLTVLLIEGDRLPRQLLPVSRGGPAAIAQERAFFPRPHVPPAPATTKAGERP